MSDAAKLRGWYAISRAIGVTEKPARAFARRNRDPLPVWTGHLGVWAHTEALKEWAKRQHMAYQVAEQLKKGQAA